MRQLFLKMSSLSTLIVIAASLSSPGRALADSFTFSLIPAGGNISGSAGTTVGWGFSITNQSSSDWLVTTNLSAEPFLHGTPLLLFDFPFLAPGQSATESFNATVSSGLYELLLDSDAPAGFVNAGNFILSAQWWTGDPTGNGVFIADASDASAPYSAAVGPSTAVPEPSNFMLLLCAAVLLLAAYRHRSRHNPKHFALGSPRELDHS